MSTFFFHTHDFVFRHPINELIEFPRVKERGIQSAITFSKINNDLVSLDKSPFGGFAPGNNVERSAPKNILREVIEWSALNQVNTIIVKCPPEIYDPVHAALVEDVFMETGFETKYKDITQVLAVSQDITEPFPARRTRLRKCVHQGFNFREIEIDFLEEAYALFVESRQSKGYPVTMTLRELQEMFIRFPDRYILFGVFDVNKMIAASVSVVVNEEILYCFYLGDALSYRSFSPIVFLLNGIYRFCAQQNFKIMDLGISTEFGILNNGLYNFKKSLGSIDSNKLTWQKKI